MGELVNRGESAIVPEGFYKQVSSILNAARDKAYTAVNFAMVEAYWEIGKSIVDEQGGEERAAYGEALIAGLSRRLTADFGRGFGIANLRNMRQFFLAFPIRDALRSELSWTHYRRLMRIPDPDARAWYMNECADSRWSTRQLERQINTMFRERLLASKDKEAVTQEIQKSAPARRSRGYHPRPICTGVFRFLGRYCVSRERSRAGAHHASSEVPAGAWPWFRFRGAPKAHHL